MNSLEELKIWEDTWLMELETSPESLMRCKTPLERTSEMEPSLETKLSKLMVN